MKIDLFRKSDNERKSFIIIFFIEIILICIAAYYILRGNGAELPIDKNIVIYRDFFCMILLSIVLYAFIRENRISKGISSFMCLDASIFLACTANVFSCYIVDKPELRILAHICEVILLTANSFMVYYCWLYIKESYTDINQEENQIYKREIVIVQAALMIGVALPIINAITGFGFSFDDPMTNQDASNFPGVAFLYIPPFVLLLITIITIARIRINKWEKTVLFTYVLIPIFSLFIFVLNDFTLNCYYTIVCATYLFIFCNLIVYRERKNVENEILLDGTIKELEIANQIQTSILPHNFYDFNQYGVDVFAYNKTAKDVGGDFYDFFMIDDNKIAIVIADVSGKGIPAAMFMMRAKSLLKTSAEIDLSPGDVLTKVNEQLCIYNTEKMFVTVWLGIIDIKNNKLVYANAGHNYPIIKNGDGSVRFLENKPSLVLAGMKNIKYNNNEIEFNDDMSLILYTDGITEAKDIGNTQFGDDRLMESVASCEKEGMEDICSHLNNKVLEFVGEAPQFDDITMLAFKIIKNTNNENTFICNPKKDSFDVVKAFLQSFLELNDDVKSISSKIFVIADEIYSNIFNYSGATKAAVTAKVDNERFYLTFKDNGIAYNPLEKDDPNINLAANDRKIGGLGIFVVKNMAENIEYDRVSGDNILKITLKI